MTALFITLAAVAVAGVISWAGWVSIQLYLIYASVKEMQLQRMDHETRLRTLEAMFPRAVPILHHDPEAYRHHDDEPGR